MPKSQGDSDLWFCRWYIDRIMSSKSVAAMSSCARGMYYDLLMWAFKNGEDGLPADEYDLRAMVGFHTDEEWIRNSPKVLAKFTERDARLFNDVMLKEYRRALKNNLTAKENGKKGGRPSRRENLSRNPESNPEVIPENPGVYPCLGFNKANQQPITNSNDPTNQTCNKPTTNARANDEPQRIGHSDLGAVVADMANQPTLAQRVKRLVGRDSWRRQGHVFVWAVQRFPSDAQTAVSYIEGTINDPGQSEMLLDRRGGFLRNKISEAAKRDGFRIPTNRKAKQINKGVEDAA